MTRIHIGRTTISPLSADKPARMAPERCNITKVARRRSGGFRYWCVVHKADATAKYGRPAKHCLAANDPAIKTSEALTLDPTDFPGGIALWGAVPAIYDTTRLPMERGIHFHARLQVGPNKDVDHTYRKIAVKKRGGQLFERQIEVNELDAVYFMVASVFGKPVKYIQCPRCGYPHLDKDWFAVHPHQSHLCHGCGRNFRDEAPGIGNPVALLQEELDGSGNRRLITAPKVLNLKQADWEGGIQIWGSNPAILWTADKAEEKGIHVHAYRRDGEEAKIDGTFNKVTIDGIELDPEMVRYLMAQSAMPHISERIIPVMCPRCGTYHFDRGELAYTPHEVHKCDSCGTKFQAPGRLKMTIGNPMRKTVAELGRFARRRPQTFDLGLRPETV